MINILLILVFLSLGLILQGKPFLPKDTARYLNQYLIYIVLPALALKHLPGIELKADLLLPVASAWICFGISWLFFSQLGKRLSWSRGLTGCLIIMAGLGNTSFVGIPVIQALLGQEAIQIALLIDQAGSFILVSSLAIIVASNYGEDKKRKRDIAGKILSFPPFVFFVIAIGLNLMKIEIPGTAEMIFGWIAMTLTPVALTSVGLQLQVNMQAIRTPYLWIGLSYKLIAIPLFIFVVFKYVFPLEGLMLKVTVLETAMAPMITGSIVAISNNLEPKLASLMVGVGIPLSFFTLAIWYGILLL